MRDVIPLEVSEDERLEFALRSFFYDFCVIPDDTRRSRGYLSNLERRLNDESVYPWISKACQAISYITHGQYLQRPQLIHKSQLLYQEVLVLYAKAMERPSFAATTDSKTLALIMGIYEV